MPDTTLQFAEQLHRCAAKGNIENQSSSLRSTHLNWDELRADNNSPGTKTPLAFAML
jgi:hypothetical protein